VIEENDSEALAGADATSGPADRERGVRPSRRPQPRGRRNERPPARGWKPKPKRSTRKRRGCLAALLFAVIVFAAMGGGVWYTLYRTEADVPAGTSVKLTIPKGTSSAAVGRILAAKGIVPNATMFDLRARMEGIAGRLKAGTYTLSTGSDYDEAFAVLTMGPPPIQYTKVTIPEGWTVGQVAARVEKATGIPGTEFTALAQTGAKSFADEFPFLESNPTDSLEGYLFPKTYEIKEKSTAADVIRLMLAQYGRETAGIDFSFASGKGVSQHGVVTIASIIEREASVAKDRPLVASVIYNRLAIHMRLQLDSTVMYVIGNKDKLLLDDLKAESPYNTYLHEGLPPGPIASPGLTALQAAAAPAKTKYLYYIMDHKDGSQSFATGYAEFLRLKAAARKGLK